MSIEAKLKLIINNEIPIPITRTELLETRDKLEEQSRMATLMIEEPDFFGLVEKGHTIVFSDGENTEYTSQVESVVEKESSVWISLINV